MWFVFDNLEFKRGLKSARTGNSYDAWVLSGTKKGFKETPDEPYERKLFDNSAATIVEGGVERPGLSVVQFFQKGVQRGDTVKITFARRNNGWDIEKLENLRSSAAAPYEPITAEQAAMLRNSSSAPAAYEPATSASSPTPPWVTASK
jgi:hypothetical protein